MAKGLNLVNACLGKACRIGFKYTETEEFSPD